MSDSSSSAVVYQVEELIRCRSCSWATCLKTPIITRLAAGLTRRLISIVQPAAAKVPATIAVVRGVSTFCTSTAAPTADSTWKKLRA